MWEIKQRVLVDMAADRGAFIDQSQSFNVHMADPNFGKLTSLHFYAWRVSRPLQPCCSLSHCWCPDSARLRIWGLGFARVRLAGRVGVQHLTWHPGCCP